MDEDFYLEGNAVMGRIRPSSDLDRYVRLEYGTSNTTWLVRSAPANGAPVRPNRGRTGWASKARVFVEKVVDFLFPPNPPARGPAALSRDLAYRGGTEDAMGAAMFLTTPRRRATVDTSELGRYSRLEYGTADPTWIVPDTLADEERHRKALERWLRGDDKAFEEWLGEPHPLPARRVETAAA